MKNVQRYSVIFVDSEPPFVFLLSWPLFVLRDVCAKDDVCASNCVSVCVGSVCACVCVCGWVGGWGSVCVGECVRGCECNVRVTACGSVSGLTCSGFKKALCTPDKQARDKQAPSKR